MHHHLISCRCWCRGGPQRAPVSPSSETTAWIISVLGFYERRWKFALKRALKYPLLSFQPFKSKYLLASALNTSTAQTTNLTRRRYLNGSLQKRGSCKCQSVEGSDRKCLETDGWKRFRTFKCVDKTPPRLISTAAAKTCLQRKSPSVIAPCREGGGTWKSCLETTLAQIAPPSAVGAFFMF